MKEDMTYNEVDNRKNEIKSFVNEIKNKNAINNADEEFFIYISKHIIFFKFLYFGCQRKIYFKIIISDLYYFIISILENKTRYMYLNERSIIENYTRLLINKSVESDHITENSFKELKENFKNIITDTDYSLIKSEYSISCSYIHGGNALEENLSFYYDECLKKDVKMKDISKYYTRIEKIINCFDLILIQEYSEFVSGCFHRKKTLLKYLLGEKKIELLFKSLSLRKNNLLI